MDEIVKFFEEKKPWSRYKDSILDYYLVPYLPKIARLGKPIAIVDCFAGPGAFKDGSDGSPQIIARRLEECQSRGAEVLAFFVEKHPELYSELEENSKEYGIPRRRDTVTFTRSPRRSLQSLAPIRCSSTSIRSGPPTSCSMISLLPITSSTWAGVLKVWSIS